MNFRKNKYFVLFLDWLPCKVQFFDGIFKSVLRRIKGEFKIWRTYGNIEVTSGFLNYNEGDFIDVGAFHGIYGFILASKANSRDRFLFLEPDLKALSRLNLNIGILSNLFPNLYLSTLSFPVGTGATVASSHHDNNLHP